jgi:uncharacterized membrane protein
VRSVIAFLPLVCAQFLCAFVLLRRDESKAWRESAAVLNVAGIGTAIALVSQTYQFHGSFADFMLTWLLLSLPLVYLLRAAFGAITYLIGTSIWIWEHDNRFAAGPMPFWLLLALVLPYLISVHRRAPRSREASALWIACAIATAFGLFGTAEFSHAHLMAPALAGFFTAIYLSGMEFFRSNDEDALHPLAFLGGVAIGVMALVLTFDDVWRFATPSARVDNWWHSLAVAVELAFPIGAVALAGWLLEKGRMRFSYLIAAFPLVVGIGWMTVRACMARGGEVTTRECASTATIFLNVYTFALGVELIARGLRAESTARTNFGLLLIAALAVARFFDSDVSFVVRAVGFIVIGVGFLLTNLLLFRRRRAA